MQVSVSASRVRHFVARLAGCAFAAILALTVSSVAFADAVPCNSGDLPAQALRKGGALGTQSQPDLTVGGPCTVRPGQQYLYGNINILAKGRLIFTETNADHTTPGDQQTDLWASAIIIEGDGTPAALNGGVMIAGTAVTPYGIAGKHLGTLTIHLYGLDQSKGDPRPKPVGNGPGIGAPCMSAKALGPCGVPPTYWANNGKTANLPLPGGVKDYFYQYGPMYGDDAVGPNGVGYFGYKVLGVGFGGTLQLFGYKGTPTASITDATNSGNSWIRLAADLPQKATSLTLASPPGVKWQKDDEIVVTTTDYLPGHSEHLIIESVVGNVVNFHRDCTKSDTDPNCPGVRWPHSGTRYKLKPAATALARLDLDKDLTTNGAETRAAVALLSRSIRIVSADDTPVDFPAPPTNGLAGYFFGGHTVFRQGFKSIQLQGVEFAQLGQGGRMGRYPVHFHMARATPANTFITDSSVNESMTRWYVLHSTQGVTLSRNVGYLSIGHGFYLEDGTETNNTLNANLGVFARAAVQNVQNPRKVPGILAFTAGGASLAYNSDVVHPTVFWITNGWNSFIGNMAAGAGTCGSCYWLTPSLNTDMPDVPMPMKDMPITHMTWSGYSGLQTQLNIAGATPLKTFYKNYCTSAMNSFETVGGIDGCVHVVPEFVPESSGEIRAVKSIAPQPVAPPNETYYPRLLGNRNPVVCPNENCATAAPCNGQDPQLCAVTVLDHYTSAFNWAEQNFSALWLRTNWYLLTDSVISDIQTGGVTFVSGGDYTKSSIPQGYWVLTSNSLFIGQTQPKNSYAFDRGPFNDTSKLPCQNFGNACVNVAEGVTMPLSGFGTGQRLFNIYDGPTYQDSNAYLDITQTPCTTVTDCIYLSVAGVRNDPANKTGYLPNAAIGWKQSNGFFYPPAFHSINLLFDNVDIRHYVIAPLFIPGTYRTNVTQVQRDYKSKTTGKDGASYFNNFTDIDRQTELSDDDGTLTGFNDTISVNQDPFFNAPVAAPECLSNLRVTPKVACAPLSPTEPTPTARTSPYDYVTTIVYPDCAVTDLKLTACGSTDNPPAIPPGKVGDDAPWKPKLVPNPNGGTFTQYAKIAGTAGQWSKDCGGPFCFGVKLYRQLLTGTDNKKEAGSTREWLTWYQSKCDTTPAGCEWPYDRMAGEGIWQRSVMTANNGVYYMDTTPSVKFQTESEFARLNSDPDSVYVDCDVRKAQKPPANVGNCQPRSVNGFQAGGTYHVLLLYGKRTTRITYQIYVGTNFNLNTVKGIAAEVNTQHFKINQVTAGDPPNWPAPTTWLSKKMLEGRPDILEVTLDLKSFTASGVLDPKKENAGLCRPRSVCGFSSGSCVNILNKTNDPRIAANPDLQKRFVKACSTWAVKDVADPLGGLIGFSFTLPLPGFVPGDVSKRPTPKAFPTDAPSGWAALFTKAAPAGNAGTCLYTNVPGTPGDQCPVFDASEK